MGQIYRLSEVEIRNATPVRKRLPFFRHPMKPPKPTQHRFAMLAGEGVDESLLTETGTSMFRMFTGDFSVVFFRPEFSSKFRELEPSLIEKFLSVFLKDQPPKLFTLPPELAQDFTCIDYVFKANEQLFCYEHEPCT